MDLAPEIAEKPDAVALPPFQGELRFDHVSFAYDPPHDVIRDFDLVAKPGETIAIVGENGSGKSTVIKLLLRFYDPTEGAVTFDGVDLRDAKLKSLRGQIGYMPQEVILFNDTIRNNIAFGHEGATDEHVEAAAKAALAHDFIVAELPDGYDTVVGEGGMKLSGGQRQRLALARAMIRDPRILILDEPTSSMDADVEHRLHDRLAEFTKGRTVILIAHRFGVLRRCDRIVALANGRIERIGTHAELLQSSPTYRNLHDKQSGEAHESQVPSRPGRGGS
jgi:ABC-type multidrug transport system fused ATPase/permease subunit